jgi:hypothetical protein
MPRRSLAEYILPNVYPKKSNSPSGTLQMRVFFSFTVSLNLPMIGALLVHPWLRFHTSLRNAATWS